LGFAMKLLIPPSVFAGILTFDLPDSVLAHLHSVPSSLLFKELERSAYDAALVPSMDLLKYKDFFVSGKVGISFDGALSNSYIYFARKEYAVSSVFLSGDVSSNDALVAKMVFEEFYNTPVQITLEKEIKDFGKKNFLISGNKNFDNNLFEKGISLSEQLSEFLDYPYVNFVWVSDDEDKLLELNRLFEKIDEKVEDSIELILKNFPLPGEAKKFIVENLNSVYFELTENERDGLNELLKYAYYKQMVEDIVEPKFVY